MHKQVMNDKQKQKYRGMFETQKSRNKTSSGDIGLNIRTLASPKVGQDQVSGGVSVPCRHATPVADVQWTLITFILTFSDFCLQHYQLPLPVICFKNVHYRRRPFRDNLQNAAPSSNYHKKVHIPVFSSQCSCMLCFVYFISCQTHGLFPV